MQLAINMAISFLLRKISFKTFSFLSYLIVLVISLEPVNQFSLNASKPVSVGETVHIYVLTPQTDPKNSPHFTDTYVTLRAVKVIYEPVTQYIFFNPKVRIQCSCACGDDYLPKCNKQDKERFNECDNLDNETTSCHNFFHEDYMHSNCPKYFQMCCQVYFSAVPNETLRAVHLVKRNTFLELEVLNRAISETPQVVNVLENMTKIWFDNFFIEWTPQFQEKEIPSDAWFVVKESATETLYHTNNINEPTEENLNKLGWFKRKDGFLGMTEENFNNHFQVNTIDCNKNPPVYEWKLNAKTLNPNEADFLPNTFQGFQLESLKSHFKSTDTRYAIHQPVGMIEFNLSVPTPRDIPFRAFFTSKDLRKSNLCIEICDNAEYEVYVLVNQTIEFIPTEFSTKANAVKTFCHKGSLPPEYRHIVLVCLKKPNKPSSLICQFVRQSPESTSVCRLYEEISSSNGNDSTYNITEDIKMSAQNSSNNKWLIFLLVGIIIALGSSMTGLVFVIRKRRINCLICQEHGQDTNEESEGMLKVTKSINNSGKGNTFWIRIFKLFSPGNKFWIKSFKLISPDFRDITKFSKFQRECYEPVPLQLVRWITDQEKFVEDMYVELQMQDDQFNGNSQECKIEEIFNRTNADRTKKGVKILIDGEVGCGKTTLLLKMAYDWVENEKYISERFKMIIFIYMRDNSEDKEVDNPTQNQSTNIEFRAIMNDWRGLSVNDCVTKFPDKILFLFDGYDKMNTELKTSFKLFFNNDKFSKSTVMITSRTGVSSDLWSKLPQDSKFRILIEGIHEEKRSIFTKNYFNNENLYKFGKCFEYAPEELRRRPLFLYFIANMANNADLALTITQTDFYKLFLNIVVTWNLYREGKISDNKKIIELFGATPSEDEREWAQQIYGFGKLALEHLIENKLTFTQKEINNNCKRFLKLGFLNTCTERLENDETNQYKPIYKSLSQVFAAYYLSRLLTENSSTSTTEASVTFKESIKRLIANGIEPNGSKPFYPCLAGFLKGDDNYNLFFEALSSCNKKYNVFEKSFLNIFREIKNPSRVAPFLTTDLIMALKKERQDRTRRHSV